MTLSVLSGATSTLRTIASTTSRRNANCFFASASVGSVLGVMLGGIIAAHWGWKAAFGVVGFPGLVLALLYLLVRDYRTVQLTPKLDAATRSTRAAAACEIMPREAENSAASTMPMATPSP